MSHAPELKVCGPDDDPYGDIEIRTNVGGAGARCVANLWQDDAPCQDYNAEQWNFARQMVAAYNATRGLTPEQVAAIPQVLSLASELVAMSEMMEEYQPGTDLYTVGEVLKLALAGAKS